MTADRRSFLASLGAAATGVVLARADARAAVPSTETPGANSASRALVLSGGGARGAYQGGLICALAERGGIADGHPLRPYELVCGTSIGAINAWFVATGNYSALRRAWSSVASEHIVELKRPYNVLTHPHRFVGEKVYAAVKLALGITKHEKGIARAEPVLDWMAKHMDPRSPVVTPMVWAVTNLTTQLPEYFYRLPPSFGGKIPEPIERAFRVTLGEHVVVREASDAELHRTLLASAAVPIVFDPVMLKMADGTQGAYVDGAVGSDAAVAIARTVARNVDIVLVDTPGGRSTYDNAIAVAMGAYATMQREILESAMRDAYLQSLGRREFASRPLSAKARTPDDLATLQTILREVPAADLAYVRPEVNLPADFMAFDRQTLIDQTFAIGEKDAERGFTA
ncbi:MAG: patatin-like phospholipase family protein, partial [Candidatus Eremiobacteraeota bacterium]|nr:patatin-like phospholipase family protein [Candidatus Eremiobacteraeota bacterium]